MKTITTEKNNTRFFCCLFTHCINTKKISGARSRLFHILPQAHQPTQSPAPSPTAPKPAGGFKLLPDPAGPPARPPQTRLSVPGEALARSPPRPPRSLLLFPRPRLSPGGGQGRRAAREGGRPRPPAPRGPTHARRTHRSRAGEETPPERGASNDSTASAPCAPPSWEAGQAARLRHHVGVARAARARTAPPLPSGQ